jgi:hypothetical protein
LSDASSIACLGRVSLKHFGVLFLDLFPFKACCYDEARLKELTELEILSEELAILGHYRFVEIET